MMGSSSLSRNIVRSRIILANQISYKFLGTQAAQKELNTTEWNSALPYDQIPGPTKWSFLRSFLPGGRFYKKSRQTVGKVLNDEYGDLVKIRGSLSTKDIVFVYNPNFFEKIYRHEGIWPKRRGLETLTYYRNEMRPELFKETGTLMTSNGEEWGKFRSQVNPIMMQPKTVKIYVPRMDKITTKFLERIRKIRNPDTNELPDNFERELNTWALEQISLVGLDTELGLIGNENIDNDAQKLIDAVSLIFNEIPELEFKPSIWKYYSTPKFKKLIEAYDTLTNISLKYVDEAIERYKLNEKTDNRDENEKSIVERLIKIDKKVAVIMAIEMFFAGVDTTTTTFTGCMLALSKNQEKQEILRQEILKILPDRNSPITEEKLKNLPYLRAVIKESHRMYPVVNEHLRSTNVPFVLGNYQIPIDSDLLMFGAQLYEKSEYFSEPDKFVPERWLRNRIENNSTSAGCPVTATKSSNPFVYLPFGFGSRMCVGKRLVDMELEILLARMVRNFYIEYNYDEKDVFELKLIYTPVKELKFKLTDVTT